MKKNSLRLEENLVYKKAMNLGILVWDVVHPWGYFQKDTIGKQWIRCTDSIAANIAEGYGRYHYKENRLFCFYGRGSLIESRTWLEKAFQRNLISQDEYFQLKTELDLTGKILNNYIKSIGPK